MKKISPRHITNFQVDMVSFEVDDGLSMKDAEETEGEENSCQEKSTDHIEPCEGDTDMPEDAKDDSLHDRQDTDNYWYITRMVGKTTSQIHISRALKIIMGRREHASRELWCRHLENSNLPDFPINNKEHDLHVTLRSDKNICALIKRRIIC